MSRTHDSLKRAGIRRRFHLRCPDGSFEGPFDISELTDRASQNRILPGAELSEDGATWMPADRLPQLKLEWMAELPDKKQYGPFSILALPRLIRTNTLPHDAIILNRKTGQKLPAHQLLKPSRSPGQSEESLRQAKETEWETRYHDEKIWRLQQETELAEMTDRLTRQLKEYETEIESLQKRIESDRQEHAAFREHASQQEEELRSRLQNLQQAAEEKEAELAEALEAGASQHAESLRQIRSEIQAERSTLESELNQVTNTLAARTEALERSSAQRDQLNDQLETFKNAAAARENELAEKLEAERSTRESLLSQAEHQLEESSAQSRGLQSTLEREREAFAARIRELEEEAHLLADEDGRLKDEFVRHKTQLEDELRTALERVDSLTVQLKQQSESLASREKSAAQRDRDFARAGDTLRRELEQSREQSEAFHNQLELHKAQSKSFAEQAHARESELRELHRKSENDARNQTAALRHANTEVARLTRREKELADRLHLVESRLTSASANALASAQASSEDAELKRQAKESAVLVNELRRKLANEMTAREQAQQESAQRETQASARIEALTLEVERASQAADSARKDRETGAETRKELEDTVRKETETLKKHMAELEGRNGALRRDLATARSDLRHARDSVAEVTAELRMTRKQCQALKAEKTALATDGPKPAPIGSPERTRVQYVAAGILALVVFVIGISMGKRLHVPKTDTSVVSESAISSTQVPVPTASLPREPVTAPSPPPAPTLPPEPPANIPGTVLALPDLTMEGLTINRRGDTTTLVFHNGIFNRFVELNPSAQELLCEIGATVAKAIPAYTIHVEGHTDNVPLSPSAPYADNRELALARALAVIKFLKTECALPARSLMAVSSSESNAPYSNNTVEDRARNRTVVLKFIATESGER